MSEYDELELDPATDTYTGRTLRLVNTDDLLIETRPDGCRARSTCTGCLVLIFMAFAILIGLALLGAALAS